jgi:hypothetical protein
MLFIKAARDLSVSKQGALAGCILRGCGKNNQALRLRVEQRQARGHDGAIRGDFVMLDAGDNMHALSLAILLNQVTNAENVVKVIRREHPGCVNVVNANILVVERNQVALVGEADGEHFNL